MATTNVTLITEPCEARVIFMASSTDAPTILLLPGLPRRHDRSRPFSLGSPIAITWLLRTTPAFEAARRDPQPHLAFDAGFGIVLEFQ